MQNTNEAIVPSEASGYDVIFVETVGVGQSETMVKDMVDMLILIVAPGAGDELQGIKKGIVEAADMIIVNKADGDLKTQAVIAEMEYASALRFVTPSYVGWTPVVKKVSSVECKGFDEVWGSMKEFYGIVDGEGQLEKNRV